MNSEGDPNAQAGSRPRPRTGGRSARVRAAVLDATIALLRDEGNDFGIPQVAARSGVHETSIYRRWGSREALIVDAVRTHIGEEIPIPDTGTLRGDLSGSLRRASPSSPHPWAPNSCAPPFPPPAPPRQTPGDNTGPTAWSRSTRSLPGRSSAARSPPRSTPSSPSNCSSPPSTSACSSPKTRSMLTSRGVSPPWSSALLNDERVPTRAGRPASANAITPIDGSTPTARSCCCPSAGQRAPRNMATRNTPRARPRYADCSRQPRPRSNTRG